jgi:hypothetical protein
MEDDESKKHTVDTVPPPADADDAYSAETKVGPASAELLEAVRRAEESAYEAAKPKPASTPPPPPPAPKKASTPPPPKPEPEPERAAPDTHRSPRVREEPVRQPGGWPPVVSIPLLFVAATIVLAALVR